MSKMMEFFKDKTENDTENDTEISSLYKAAMLGVIGFIDMKGRELYDQVAKQVGPKFAIVFLSAALSYGETLVDIHSDDFVNGDPGIPGYPAKAK